MSGRFRPVTGLSALWHRPRMLCGTQGGSSKANHYRLVPAYLVLPAGQRAWIFFKIRLPFIDLQILIIPVNFRKLKQGWS